MKGFSRVAGFTILALGLAAVGQVPASTLLSQLQWRSVGPYVGGRVVAIAGVASDPNLYYLGAAGGGIWKTTDGGLQWMNISDGKLPSSSPSIGALAVAASNPKVIYAGTGESDIRNDMIAGDGVYRSDDGGDTWHFAGLRDTHTISALVVDPQNPDVVYASSMGHVFVPGSERGVYKSTDGGKNWTKILFVDDHTGAIDIVMQANNPRVLYASMWQAVRTPYSLVSGGPGSGLYKTTDGGAHWNNITASLGLGSGLVGRMGVGLSADNPNVVYVIAQAKDGGVFRSSNGGQSWTRVNQEWKLRQRAFYYMSIYPDPKDANTVYVPEVDALWVSRDGGKTWTELHTPHGDNHIVWVNPNQTNILLEGNDGGATVSTDSGKSWSSEDNQPTGQFYQVNLDQQFPFHLYGAQQDEGSTEGPSASSNGAITAGDWQRVAYGESTFVVPQPGDSNITYGSGYFSIFLRYNLSTGQYKSVSPWPNYQEGASSAELKYRMGWTHPILFSQANPKELLVGAQDVLKSDDYGQTWQTISPDLTRNDPATEAPSGGPVDLDQSSAEVYPGLSALAVSPLDGQVIWAGSDDGLIHVTRDGGQSWQAVNPAGLPDQSWVSSIQPSVTDAGTAYLTTQRYMWDDYRPYVYKTTDYGQHWTPMINGLPDDSYVLAIRPDPNDANLLFLGTRNTAYVSLNGGDNWQPLTLNLPPVVVRDIAIDSRQGEVAIATHGRAFWVLDNLSLLEQLSKNPPAAADAATLFAPQEAWLSHFYGAGDFPLPDAGKNPPFGATVFFHIPSNYDGTTPATLTFRDAQGNLIRSFALHRKPPATPASAAVEATPATTPSNIVAGMNSFQWDLRYAPATEVTGFQPPVAAGGLDDSVNGPVVTPGSYTVTLDYDGQKTQQSLQVGLDPNLTASADDLAACLELQLKIHAALDALDRKLNDAIALRAKLKPGAAGYDGLNQVIGSLVQLDIRASEGSLLHETKLRSHLAYLAADLDLAYARPTAAQYAVFQQLDAEATAGEQRLDAAVGAAR